MLIKANSPEQINNRYRAAADALCLLIFAV